MMVNYNREHEWDFKGTNKKEDKLIPQQTCGHNTPDIIKDYNELPEKEHKDKNVCEGIMKVKEINNNPKVNLPKIKLPIRWYFKWKWFFLFVFLGAIIVSCSFIFLLPEFSRSIWSVVAAGVIGFTGGFMWGLGRAKHIKRLKVEYLVKNAELTK